MLTLTTVLCLIDSVIIFTTESDITAYKFNWREDGWFIAAMIINIICVFIVFVMFVIHKLFWEKVYTRPRGLHKKEKVLHKEHWYNSECDGCFEPYIKSGKIKVI